MGTDSGLQSGTAVVDTNTKVYGTDNIFVVDASIFPGMPSTNPSALVVMAAERASEVILALPELTAVQHVRSPIYQEIYLYLINNLQYGQCGGAFYGGSTYCEPPYTCVYSNPEYSQVVHPIILYITTCLTLLFSVYKVSMKIP